MEITLKKAILSDYGRLHTIQVRAFSDLLEKYQDHSTSPGAEDPEAILRRFAQPFTNYYLILKGETEIGMLRVCNHGTRCRLSPICILPEYQGRGAAQQAMRLAEARYPEAKCWELDTILQEKRLCALYEKMGYRPTGKTERIKDGMDLIYYEKHL